MNTVMYYTDANNDKWKFEGTGTWQKLDIPMQPPQLKLELESVPNSVLACSMVTVNG